MSDDVDPPEIQIVCIAIADNYDQWDPHDLKEGKYAVKDGKLTHASDLRGYAMRSQALKRSAETQIKKEDDTDGMRPCYVYVRAGTNLIDAIAEMPPAKDPRDEERGAGPEPRPETADEKQAPRRPAGSSPPAAIRSTAGAQKEPEKTPEEIRAHRERVKADIDAVGKSAEIQYTMEKYPDAEGRASEVFRSITEEIAIGLAEKAAARARNPKQAYPPEDVINAAIIKRIWEQTEVCRHLHGSGRREYAESEEAIIQEALTCGLQAYHDKAAAGGPAPKTEPETDPSAYACDAILCGGDPFGADAEDGRAKYAPKDSESVEIVVNGQTTAEIKDFVKNVEKKCREIWEGPDTLEQIAYFVQERHYGDRIPIKMILLASMQHRIPTIPELSYISINGESGAGKSDLVKAIAEVLPRDAVKIGTVSAKFMPHMGAMWDGKIIFLDDQQPDPDNIEYMKICNANGTTRPTYGTLLHGGKGETNFVASELELPMGICYIIARVDTAWGADAEQVQNRIITVYLDDTEEQKQRVLRKMTERMQVDYVDDHQNTAAIMRDKLWMGLPDRIYVDFRDIIGRIDTKNIENRMYGHLLNMIASYAVYRQWPGSEEQWQGKWRHDDAATHEPIIYAAKEDAIPVIDMFNSFLTIPADVSGDANAGGNVYKFSKAEKRVHDTILQKYRASGWHWKSVRAMADDLGIDRETTRIAVNGRKTTLKTDETTGLLAKMPGLYIERESKTRGGSQTNANEGENDDRTTRSYNVIIWDPDAYQQDRDRRKCVITWTDEGDRARPTPHLF